MHCLALMRTSIHLQVSELVNTTYEIPPTFLSWQSLQSELVHLTAETIELSCDDEDLGKFLCKTVADPGVQWVQARVNILTDYLLS